MARNQTLIPAARNALDQLKFEVANEIGLLQYATMDKGELPAKFNGAVGGNMVKRMIAAYEQSLAKNTIQ